MCGVWGTPNSLLHAEVCAVTAAMGTWVWRHSGSPWAPPFQEGAPDAVSCAQAQWDPPKSSCLLLFPHRADSGRQPGCSKTKLRTCLCLPPAPQLSVGICPYPSGCDSTAVYGLLVGAVVQKPNRLCTPKVSQCWKFTFFLLLPPIGTEVW